MKTIAIKGVLLRSGEDYFIHGTNSATPVEMFKVMTGGQQPMWNFDPSADSAHYVELEVRVPELEFIDVPADAIDPS